MQILGIEVAQAMAPSGQPILRVQFCGGEATALPSIWRPWNTETKRQRYSGQRPSWSKLRPSIVPQTITMREAMAISTKSLLLLRMMRTAASISLSIVMAKPAGRFPPCILPAGKPRVTRGSAAPSLFDLQPGQDALTGWLVRVRGENGDLIYTVDVGGRSRTPDHAVMARGLQPSRGR